MKYEELYCFSFNPKLDREEREQGWMLIDLSEEYKRMGLLDNYWQLSDVNRDYRVSTEAFSEMQILNPDENMIFTLLSKTPLSSPLVLPALSRR